MNYLEISSITELDQLHLQYEAILVYFSHDNCNVCKVLKPKVAELLSEEFPKIKAIYANTERSPELAGQNQVFTVPTLLVYFGGHEYIRASRNISIPQLEDQIRRPYEMMFE